MYHDVLFLQKKCCRTEFPFLALVEILKLISGANIGFFVLLSGRGTHCVGPDRRTVMKEVQQKSEWKYLMHSLNKFAAFEDRLKSRLDPLWVKWCFLGILMPV